MTIRITGDGPKITATGSGSTVLVEISTGQHDPGSFSGVHNDLTGRSTTGAHVGTAVSIDPTGFAGNLDGTITNAQLLAAAVDDLTTGGGGGGGAVDSVDGRTGAVTLSDLYDAAGAAQAVADTLGGAAALDVGTTAGTVAAGDDARLSDARTPNVAGSNDDFMQRKAGAWTHRTVAQVQTDLGVVAPTWTVVSNQTLAVDTASLSFSSLSSYVELEIRWSAWSTNTTTNNADMLVRFNGVSTNTYYRVRQMRWVGTSGDSNQSNTSSGWAGIMPTSQTDSLRKAEGVIRFRCDQPAGRYKSIHGSATSLVNGDVNAVLGSFGSYWANSSDAITSIELFPTVGSFATGSVFTVLGRPV